MRRFLAAVAAAVGVLGFAEDVPAQPSRTLPAQPSRTLPAQPSRTLPAQPSRTLPAHAARTLPAHAARALQSALSHSLASAGGASGAYVVDLTTGHPLYSARPEGRRLPASVEKIYTTSTALARFGANATLQTSVRAIGSLDANGTWHGTMYLKGAGDPTFGSVAYDRSAYGARTGATLQRLVANLLRTNHITAIEGAIVGDESTLDSHRGTIATGFAFSPYVEGELSGLVYDRGFADASGSSIQNRPALFATQQFVAALRAAGVQIPKGTRVYTHVTPAAAQQLATVNSPRMATLIQMTNTPSDNFFAEMLLKDLGARFGGSGSSAAGAAVVRSQLATTFGINPRIDDGSGLSRGTGRALVTSSPCSRGFRATPRSRTHCRSRARRVRSRPACRARTRRAAAAARAARCTTWQTSSGCARHRTATRSRLRSC